MIRVASTMIRTEVVNYEHWALLLWILLNSSEKLENAISARIRGISETLLSGSALLCEQHAYL